MPGTAGMPFWKKTFLVVVSTALLAALGYAIYVYLWTDEDRPPIIVRSGSLIFEAGDANDASQPGKWKNWKKLDLEAKWKPDHGRGASVTGYSVLVQGASNPSICGTAALTASEVSIDYTEGTTTTTARVFRALTVGSSKWEPMIEGPPAMTLNNKTGKTPGQAIYANEGYIATVRVGTTTCTFDRPPQGQPGSARISIQPLR